MATHHPALDGAQVVHRSSSLTLSAAEHDGHHRLAVEIAELEDAFTWYQTVRAALGDDYARVHVDVALRLIYREIVALEARRETVAADPAAAERALGDLWADTPADAVTERVARYVGTSDGEEWDAPTGAGDSVEAYRG